MDRKLVLANEKDLGSIAGIYSVEFSKPPYGEEWTEEKALRKISFYHEFYDLYSVLSGEEVVGFSAVNANFMCPGEVAFLEEFAVREDFQGRGIGGFVLDELIGIYRDKGFSRFMCISNFNSPALGLYLSRGLRASEGDVLLEREL